MLVEQPSNPLMFDQRRPYLGNVGQMKANDLDSAIEQSHAALGAILKGDPSGYQALYSDAEDVTLGNPFGPYACGRQKVEATLAGAASHYRDGEVTACRSLLKFVGQASLVDDAMLPS